MTFFNELIEKVNALIDEHGSAAILRERLELLHERIVEKERQQGDLEAQDRQTQARLEQAQHRLRALEKEVERLRAEAPLAPGALCCEACGSLAVRLVGKRISPGIFGASTGLKEAIYRCQNCGKDSFVETPS